MGMSGGYGPADDKESIATIHAALDAGITYLDTADVYGMGQNEMLLREALKGGRRERAFIGVKFGAQRGPDGKWLAVNTHPDAVKTYLAYTLRRLGTDYVDLYQPARVDPKVPIEDTVGAIAEMVKAGYVRHLLSRRARHHPARARRASSRGAADRVFDLQPHRARSRRPCARSIRDGRWRAVAWADRGPAAQRGGAAWRNPHPHAALPRRSLCAQSGGGRCLALDREGKGLQRRAARFRLGALARRDILAGRRQASRSAGRRHRLAWRHYRRRPARIDAAAQAKRVAGERYSPALMAHLDSEQG
jgi:hypothetical protein